VAGEDPPAELIGFALPEHSHAGALESEVEAADAGEEASNGQHRVSL
jgi:hypothetical protein